MIIRRQQPRDAAAIRALHRAAFGCAGGGEVAESRLVDRLWRDGDAVPALSLVALTDDAVVGHVMCSRAAIAGRPSLGLGPLGVLPAHQGRGVGQALMHAVIAAADAVNESAVLLLGDPAYYRRFGFVPAEQLGILPPEPSWGSHFQVRPLAAWDEPRGLFQYARAFGRL